MKNLPIGENKDEAVKNIQAALAKYYGLVSEVDHHVGRIIETLEQTGQIENTIIVFTSDHGDMMGDQGLIGKGPMLFDSVLRVPLIFYFPPALPAGVVVEGMTEQIDVMPTLLEMAGIDVPANVQGVSLLPMINGDAKGKEVIFSEYGQGLTGDKSKMKMARTEQWKLVYTYGDTSELYDLVNDPDELVNLYGHPEYQDAELRMMRHLMDWVNETEPYRPPMEEADLLPVSVVNQNKGE